ncbi:MAG TPA: PQQ-binding-like beta-propeller repeat protein [Pirellulales bacterium]|nr:PQQ-binding-like beta-propeller repeat protein [Pirellulales bacterium]
MRTVCAALFGLWAVSSIIPTAMADDWPQWRGPNRDGVWRETGLLEKFPGPQIKLRWRAPISSGYSGPTVADGRVYVTDRVIEPNPTERVHCFDWQSGEKLWSHEYNCPYKGVGYEAGPRASVTIDDGRALALGAMGNLFCFDAAKGDVLWERDLNTQYKTRMPIWGIAASPLVEQGLVIVQIGGADGACLVAFDVKTGEERWRALDDAASYASPIMVEQAGRRVLVCWTGAHVVGLDPLSGQVHWQQPFQPTRMVISIATPVSAGGRLFVSSFYDGSLMLRLKADELTAEQVWRRLGPDEKKTDALHSIISTPLLKGDCVYGVDSYGELRCLDANTGDRLWESLEPMRGTGKPGPKIRWFTIHMVENADKVWMFNERGEMLITKLSPDGYEEISRARLIEPTTVQLNQRGGVCWAHPAYAYRHVFARNDSELVAADLSAARVGNAPRDDP